ncbi:hypothetical protein [Pseudothauera rhizosphaerae]|uniref:Uncharacterized protein n=1 Tax=Pseudothauera rhizosphaerae TaxID=2565932 RepID=A0A4V3WAV3_9RHOO|nr:hypothetical protein [Pseudothauera rhizosphaerae]THF60665.1 hypothetical protein E6O51_12860 [Pseudothauera rhizosphaerae]
MESVAVIVLLAAAGLLFYVRTRAGGEEGSGEEAPPPLGEHGPSFHAVEVRAARDGGCEMVRALRGIRFLSTEAPPIPLPSCSRGRCACFYVHHEDRRSGQRRDPRAQAHYLADGDRRGSSGRRALDQALYGTPDAGTSSPTAHTGG